MSATFAAIYLLGNKNRCGFLLMTLGNLCWAGIGIWMQSIAMIVANAAFCGMNLRAFLKWRDAAGESSPTPERGV